ncbi:DUF2510 domain-containing protein [Clavibacter phaseoli]|uniref:DUF2510 domain-containing protein n=1 Tax=Clavibacter phaseoli TaxID=1734031 RepID=UPI000E65FD50|nr:DUF2510 domain-containing protein [Clavibacter phaseoli]RIJ54967.1 DUF2510 domain-containing protein [Clavibacter phaseoli]UKF31580.1 DUF2510 domain-containing protein [Clavibacter phaseoli]UKF37500.1 DUF2510 domain-containing protein [Clavibacter phaseoli]
MTDSTGTPSTPAGWYADPAGSDRLRWWDGTRWTDHLADAPTAAASTAATEPAAAPASGHVAPEASAASAAMPPAYGQQAPGQPYAQQPYSPQPYAQQQYTPATPPPQVPASTPPFTWAIWVLAALPVISLISILGLDLRQTMTPMQYGRGAMLPGLGYVVVQLVSFLVYGASVAVAYFDWRDLGRRGIVRPFHWAWTFLGSGVYVIGRSVIVRRRITGNPGRVLAPLWLWIGVTVIFLFVFTVKWVDAFMGMMQMYGTRGF